MSDRLRRNLVWALAIAALVAGLTAVKLWLQALDDVAYVRFASVYRQFKDISEFMDELKGLLDHRSPQTPATRPPR